MGKRQHIKEPTIYLAPKASGWLLFVEPAPSMPGVFASQFDTRSDAMAYGNRLARRFGWRFILGDAPRSGHRG